MATYNPSAVADAAIAHKKGITLQTGRALRDNPIAMAEGAAGAPGINGLATGRDSASDAEKHLPVVAVTAADTVTIKQGLGKDIKFSTIPSNTETDLVTYVVNSYTGSVRFKYSDSGGSGGSIKFYKNGSVVYTTSIPVGASFDSTVALGDTFKWTAQDRSGSAVTTTETASDGYIEVPVYGLASKFPTNKPSA